MEQCGTMGQSGVSGILSAKQLKGPIIFPHFPLLSGLSLLLPHTHTRFFNYLSSLEHIMYYVVLSYHVLHSIL